MRMTIIFLLALLPALICAQSTDTLWSVPQLDGSISFRPGSGTFTISTNSAGFIPGDGFDVLMGEEVFSRAFLSFDLSNLSNTDTSSIAVVIFGIYQLEAIGNDIPGVYPIWNVAGGDTHFCVLDHIDYGSGLDLGDWTAGDPGDPKTLQSNIGIISSDTTIEYKTMNVTSYVKGDIANQRMYNQYRMRFTIDTDFDGLGDILRFRSGNSIVTHPYLAIGYHDTTAIISNPQVTPHFHLKQNYPNPFNPVTTIAYMLPKAGKVRLTIFDLTGREVRTLINKFQLAGSYKVQFDGSGLSSGVYWYSLKYNHQIITKKMGLIH